MNAKQILKQITRLRLELAQIAQDYNLNLQNPRVIQASQHLDNLIIQYQLWCKDNSHDKIDSTILWDRTTTLETNLDIFKWKQYEAAIILLTVRWYLKYSISYRDLVEMMLDRGLKISHTTIMRWVHEFGPGIDKRIRTYLNPTNDSYRTDETYIKVKGQWKYLYRAVDSMGKTIEFMLSENRDKQAAKRFFAKTLSSPLLAQ